MRHQVVIDDWPKAAYPEDATAEVAISRIRDRATEWLRPGEELARCVKHGVTWAGGAEHYWFTFEVRRPDVDPESPLGRWKLQHEKGLVDPS